MGKRMRRFDQSLPMALLAARESIMAFFRPHLNELGLTEQQWRIIRVLREHDELEFHELASIANHIGSIAQCLERVDVPAVVVTLGAQGCCVRSGSSFLLQPSFAVTPVDTTGAGDTFCGVLVAALSEGNSMPAAMRRAAAAAALACTQSGAQSSIPTRDAVSAFLHTQTATTAHQETQLREFCGLPPTLESTSPTA